MASTNPGRATNDPLIEVMKREFQKRQGRNPSYSLRSYASYLKVDPSNLSKMLSGQKKIGPALRGRLGQRLGFEKAEIDTLLEPAFQARTEDHEYANHTLGVFQVISEWQHYAILECFKLQDIVQTPGGIAARLGLSVATVEDSLKRLIRVGLLRETDRGLVPQDESSSSILNISTSKAHREQQRQILEGAIEALESVPVELRSQSSVTFAIDSRRLDMARQIIKKFRRDMGRLLSASSSLDNVYQLSVSLYPVTKTRKKQEKL